MTTMQMTGIPTRAEDAIWKKGILVQIKSKIWSMEAKLEARDIDKAPDEIPEFVSLGKKKLFSNVQKDRFTRLTSRGRSTADRLGFDFPVTGSVFVPFKNFDALKALLEAQQAQFYAEVDLFIENYESNREAFLNEHEEHRTRLEEHYPVAETIREKFAFTVMYFATSMGNSINGSQSGDEIYMQFVLNAMNELREDAQKVAASIKASIADGKFDGRTERKIFKLIERLGNMDLLEDSNLKDAAFRLAVAPTPANADALNEAAAVEVTSTRVRAVLLD